MNNKLFPFQRQSPKLLHFFLFPFIFCLLSYFCSISNLLQATTKTDSLLTVLGKAKADTQKVKLLNVLGSEFKSNNLDTAILLSTQALSLAKNIILPGAKGWQKGIAQSLHNLAVFSRLKGSYFQSLEYCNKEIEIWNKFLAQKQPPDFAKNGKAAALGNMGSVYLHQSDYQRALQHYHEALEIAMKLGEKNYLATLQSNIGNIDALQGNYSKALEHYFGALETMKEIGDKEGVTTNLCNIGIIYRRQGDYPKALKYYFDALSILNELENKNGIAKALGNIGVIYRSQGDSPNALRYYYEALEIDQELGNKAGMVIRLGSIGNVYYDQNKNTKALKYYSHAHEIASEIGDKNRASLWLGSIGNVFVAQGDSANIQGNDNLKSDLYNKALKHYLEALVLNKEMGNKRGVAIWSGNIGSLYNKTRHFEKSEAYLDSALAVVKEIDILEGYLQVYLTFSELYENTSRYQLALQHYKNYVAAKDSIFNVGKSKEIGGLEAKHEWEMQRLAEAKQKLEEANRKAQYIERRNLLQYSGIVLLIGLLLMGLFFSKKIMVRLPEKLWFLNLNKKSMAFGLLFATVFLFFETILIYVDSDIEMYTRGNVILKTILSVLFAGTVSIVYFLLERKLESRLGLRTNTNKRFSGKGFGFIFAFIVFQSFIFYPSSTKVNISSKHKSPTYKLIDSLKIQLAQCNSRPKTCHDTVKFIMLEKLFVQYFNKHADSAMQYATLRVRLAKKLNSLRKLAEATNNIARLHWIKGNYPATLKKLHEILKIYEQINDKAGYAQTVGNIGIVYRNIGDYSKALKHYFEALEIDKELENKDGISRHLGNIGNVYSELKVHSIGPDSMYILALKYYFEALNIDKEIGNKRGMAIRIGSIGNIYNSMGENSKLELSSRDSLYAKALIYYTEALEIASDIGDKNRTALWLGNIGALFTKIGRYNDAEAYIDSAIRMSEGINNLAFLKDQNNYISQLYDTTARYQLALHHYKKYDAAKDSLYNEEKSKDIGKLETRHEMEIADFNRKQKEADAKEAAQIIKAREDKIGYTLVLVGFIIILGITILLSRLTLPVAAIQIATTIPFLLLFETAVVFLEPYIEAVTDNAPALKLGGNFVLALLLFPLHDKAEMLLKRLLQKRLREKLP